jgi:hypothetical protein
MLQIKEMLNADGGPFGESLLSLSLLQAKRSDSLPELHQRTQCVGVGASL